MIVLNVRFYYFSNGNPLLASHDTWSKTPHTMCHLPTIPMLSFQLPGFSGFQTLATHPSGLLPGQFLSPAFPPQRLNSKRWFPDRLLPPAQPTSTPGFPASSYWPEMISWFLSLLSVSLASMYPTSPTRAGTVSPLSLDPQHPEGCLAPYASDLLKLYYQETEGLRSSFSMSYCAQFTISVFPTCLPSWGKLQPGTELRRGI